MKENEIEAIDQDKKKLHDENIKLKEEIDNLVSIIVTLLVIPLLITLYLVGS